MPYRFENNKTNVVDRNADKGSAAECVSKKVLVFCEQSTVDKRPTYRSNAIYLTDNVAMACLSCENSDGLTTATARERCTIRKTHLKRDIRTILRSVNIEIMSILLY